MSKHSQVEILCDEAQRLALNTIQTIDKERKEMRERFIDNEVERCNNTFFHKLFRLKPVTREIVIAADEASSWGELDMIKCTYQRQYETAWTIYHAAKAGGKLLLSLDDYQRIT